jgi:hypothetical protein
MTLRQGAHKKGCGRLWLSWACYNRNRTILLSLHNYFPTPNCKTSINVITCANVYVLFTYRAVEICSLTDAIVVASGLSASNSTCTSYQPIQIHSTEANTTLLHCNMMRFLNLQHVNLFYIHTAYGITICSAELVIITVHLRISIRPLMWPA